MPARAPVLNPVDHPGVVVADIFEFVDMPPAHRNPRRQRSQSGCADRVDETPRRIVTVRLVLGHQRSPPGSASSARPFCSESASVITRIGCHGGEKPQERTGPAVPGEHLVARRVDHA